MDEELGTLVRVDLRDVWQNEAGDFTPWLARSKNLKRLAQTLGMELELEAEEKNVGPFRADILCRDATNDAWVLIENQLERTDHVHLGQLLTYAAGLDAATIVWVAQQFTDEHRAALDWLNEKTPGEIAFFGLEVELWKIGNSPAAPKFNVVCRPNEWVRSKATHAGDSELAQLCCDYWTGVLNALTPSEIVEPNAKPWRAQNMVFPVDWHDFWLKAYFSYGSNQLGVWVACRGPDRQTNYNTLLALREQIETDYGHELNWREEPTQGVLARIFPGIDPKDRSDWAHQHALLAEQLTKLYKAVNPFISELKKHDETD